MKGKKVGEIIKEIAPKRLKPLCSQHCRKKCSEKITNQNREEIFHKFWEGGDINVQRAYILKNVTVKLKS